MPHGGRAELTGKRDRLLDGVKKLADTNTLVSSMRADLAHLQPELEARAASSAELLVKVCCSVVLSFANKTGLCFRIIFIQWSVTAIAISVHEAAGGYHSMSVDAN